ncbi:MAG TPA: Asp-tRNA(Asn)/Glu-tRNA(Gln) amidotransferase subunit GatC [Longimicrobiales bacterium]|nr:Asp-tRNA(Asn)/Glu-tRNA(Gln) amidotransferase subunit GatC [Longimicrobiales bacterium]
MPVSAADVAAAAALARLQLEPGAAAGLARELESILAHVETLAAAHVDGIPPTASAADVPAALRADVPAPEGLQVPLEAMAPAWRDGFFTVPRLAAHRGDRSHE